MKKRFSALNVALACILSACIAIGCMSFVFVSKYGEVTSVPAAGKFAAIYNVIENYYVGDADMEQIADFAYRAMVYATEDEWSYYMSPEEYEEYKHFQDNTYSGIGITVSSDGENPLHTIEIIAENSPAQRAGLLVGDTLLTLDGKNLEGMSSSEIRALIVEKEGKEFQISVKTKDGTEKTVTVASEAIYTEPVKGEMLENNVGYIKIKNFETGCGEGINTALDKLVADGAKSIVFDVRNNPGGLLEELLKALDHILPEGEIFVSRDKLGNEKVETSNADCVDIPMAVLINENTYSAAEFFAAALSEFDWATTVGSSTTGKARSQISIELTDGSAVHISTNSYLTPKRVDLSETGGLVPNIKTDINEENAAYLAAGQLAHDKDEQLLSAISGLNADIDK
ncbi:MAG: S41 family peptidase [Oscillospiraceae bacterium]